jgi:hypothetical protein
VEILFERGSLAGPVQLAAALRDGAGEDLACGAAAAVAEPGAEPVDLALASPGDDLNCGRCGRTCAAAHATSHCDASSRGCGPLSCEPGWLDRNGERDDGCEVEDPGCVATGTEDAVESCSGGNDEDCDGKTDCDDEGCAALTRACAGPGGCTGTETWDCATTTWGACQVATAPEADPAACSDGLDGDCDGKTDCDETAALP